MCVGVCAWTDDNSSHVNLLKGEDDGQRRIKKKVGRLVSSAPRKSVKELDFNIPVMTKQRH